MNFSSFINSVILPVYQFSSPYIIKIPMIRPVFNFLKPYLVKYGYQILLYLNDIKIEIYKYIETPSEDKTYSIYDFNSKIVIDDEKDIKNFLSNNKITSYLLNQTIENCQVKKIVIPINPNKIQDNLPIDFSSEQNNVLRVYNSKFYPKHLILSALAISGNDTRDITDLLNKYLMGCPKDTKLPIKYLVDDDYKPLISKEQDIIKIVTDMADEIEFSINDTYLTI